MSEASEINPFEKRFASLQANSSCTVLVDKATGVCYLIHKKDYEESMSLLVDTNGDPITYSSAMLLVESGITDKW